MPVIGDRPELNLKTVVLQQISLSAPRTPASTPRAWPPISRQSC